MKHFLAALFVFWLMIFLFPLRSVAQIHEKVNVDLVNVYLTATDSKGHFITNLKQEELTLREDGVVQKVTNFTNFALEKSDKLGEKDVPLTMAFVVDTSESMGQEISGQQKIDIVKNAAFRLFDEMRPEDSTTLITFNDTPTEITPLTTDRKKIQQDLLFQDVEGGNTAVLDSIYFALDKIKTSFGRKIIVICSDGEDTASYLKFDEVLSNLIASDVTVLAFGTMALNSSSVKGRFILEKMAEASGGYAFFPGSLNALDEVMEKLRQGMRSQYSLAYRPTKKPDGSWRKIQITTSRGSIKLRYRQGYYAK